MLEHPATMTKEQYEEQFAARSGCTVDHLHKQGNFALPCDCIDKVCSGWVMVCHYGEDVIDMLDTPGDIARSYSKSLTEHIHYVQMAARYLRVPQKQIYSHDKSKWTPEEFTGYAVHFKGGGAPGAFAKAWLHHIHHNPHHWQHWIFSDGYTPKGGKVEDGVVEMPEMYALEMVADWMGASRAYTGSWDMTEWLIQNMPKIRVHSRTAEYLRETLDALGYADIVNGRSFGKE